MRPRSKKGAARSLVRADIVRFVLAERPVCEWPGCTEKSADVHEPHTRGRGGDELDVRNCRAACRRHHDVIHAHPKQAEVLGFMASGSTPSRSRDLNGMHDVVRTWIRFDEIAWGGPTTVAKVAAHFGPDVYALLGDLVDKGLVERRGNGLVTCGPVPDRFDDSTTEAVSK